MIPLFATTPHENMVQAAMLAILLFGGLGLWGWIFVRWRRREPIIPLARRRPVPWQAVEVLFLFLVFYLLPVIAAQSIRHWIGPDAVPPAKDQETSLAHPAEQLLGSDSRGAIAVAVTVALVVAPLIEEFFFRVLLQGWLEAVWSRRRRKCPGLREAPAAWLPVVLPAMLFALMHLRGRQTALPPRFLVSLFLGQMAAQLLVLGVALALLRFALGATASDLGWKPGKLGSDARLGLLGLLAVLGPVLVLQVAVTNLVKAAGVDYALDPIPLFFLALALGVLYRRTHRIAPSLVLHVAFNATSVLFFFALK
jgi:membrane protease YdiL (CAAX protease family)